ncbi:hypothetical protein ACIRL0_22250 [Streptomyces sp. NPDC102365]|uniref:hypothetical protein n=1 Tax=Streptomyces sp. NPDC102365 TaxID=3366162 RepID=UPI0037FD1784
MHGPPGDFAPPARPAAAPAGPAVTPEDTDPLLVLHETAVPAKAVQDPGLARRLWTLSEELTRTTFPPTTPERPREQS